MKKDCNKSRSFFGSFFRKRNKETYRTGFEGREFESIETVNCPVSGGMVSRDICNGCSYYKGHDYMDRGRKKKKVELVICSAPQLLRVHEIVVRSKGGD